MKVLLYGDSNTFGTAPMRSLGSDGVVARRWGAVLAEGLPGHEVVVEGLPGRTTVHNDPIEGGHMNGRTVMPAILGSHRPIELLAICLGTNDQKARFGLTGLDIALSLGRLVREATATGWVARVLVICPPPVKECGVLAQMFSGASERCGDLAKHAANIAKAEGAAFFDAGKVIECDDLDGIHWNDAAHEALGAALIQPVRALLK